MRCLNRNKRKFWYALYEGRVPMKDEDGKFTGEYGNRYSNPIAHKANISAARGETVTRQFGEDESYDKVIVDDDVNLPIDEHSVLWIDTVPSLNEDGSLVLNENEDAVTPYDYEVKKVATSLNSTLIAVQKVDVDG